MCIKCNTFRTNSVPTTILTKTPILNPTIRVIIIPRAEKEKAQYYGELNDMRSSTNRLVNDKVEHSVTIRITSKFKINDAPA